jgi:hypothetical protein
MFSSFLDIVLMICVSTTSLVATCEYKIRHPAPQFLFQAQSNIYVIKTTCRNIDIVYQFILS